MTPREGRAALAELTTATGGRAQLLADRLRTALGREPWVDAAIAHEITARVRPHLEPGGWRPKALAPGETWLLVFFASRTAGAALRLRASSRSTDAFGAEARTALACAREGLVAELGRACRQLPRERIDFEIGTEDEAFEIDGPSLGVASCVATLSRALGTAPADHVAASAVVLSDGALAPVAHLSTKLAALAAQWPHVRTVVVAEHQPIEQPLPPGLSVRRRGRLLDALADFELDVTALPQANVDDFANHVETLRVIDASADSTTAWETHRSRALEAAHVLHADGSEPTLAAKALAYAALFALHGGDPEAADRVVELYRSWNLPEDTLPEAVRIFIAVVAATRAIDLRPAEAIEAARGAEARARAASDRTNLGRAIGTHGRALMHAGELETALPLLREAESIHAKTEPNERHRSATYVAICLRKLGRAAEALELLDATRAALGGTSVRPMLKKTRMYVDLERGRCLHELDRLDEAIAALDAARSAQGSEEDYPRLGATRSLVAALRAADSRTDADRHLRTCIMIAEGSARPLLRKAAAIAVVEALVAGPGATELPLERLEAAALAAFPDAPDTVLRQALLKKWIY